MTRCSQIILFRDETNIFIKLSMLWLRIVGALLLELSRCRNTMLTNTITITIVSNNINTVIVLIGLILS